jgi:hypothetical protein
VTPTALARYDASSCTTDFLDVGPQVSSGVMELRPSSGGGAPVCAPLANEPSATDPSLTFFRPGPPIDLATFEAVSDTTLGSSRIRAQATADSGGVPLVSGGLVDTDPDVGGVCKLLGVAGVLRCAPSRVLTVGAVGGGAYFSDAACTVPLAAFSTPPTGACGAGPPPSPTLVLVETDVCGNADLHAVGDRFTGSTWMVPFGSTCQPSAAPADVTLHRIGDVVPADRFAAVVARVE